MRRFLIAVTLFFAAAGLAPAAMAQEAATPEKIALVKRYFAAIEFDQTMDRMTKAMVPMMVKQAKNLDPKADTKGIEAMMSISLEITKEHMPQILDSITNVYAEAFTEDELKYMVSFYEDPRGRAIMRKTADMTPKMMEAMSNVMPDMMKKMRERMCAKIDCPKPVEFKPAAGQ